eukprot:s1316_g17.t1
MLRVVHGTDENLIPSISRQGLLPGATRRSRKHNHFVTDNMLSTHEDAVRREPNVLIIYPHDGLDIFRVWRTKVGYLLCADIVPLSRAIGIWSLRARCWYQKPEDSILQEMTDMSSEKDIMCHITHLQLIYDKRQSLGKAADQWSRQQFLEYVTRAMQDPDVMGTMLENFHKPMPENQKGYVNLDPNPNERPLGDPEDEDTARIREMKNTLFQVQMKAVKRYMKAKHGGVDTSASEATDKGSESEGGERLEFGFKKKILAKNTPRPATPPTPKGAAKAATASAGPKKKEWRKKKEADTSGSESAAEPASSSARASGSASASASAGHTAKAKTTNKAPRRETSKQAQELFKDAQAAHNVFVRWTQEFTNLEWFAHPGEKFPCKNHDAICNCDDAMFWCHKCGAGYCLQCRYDGQTCTHSIAHYSVDTDPDFLSGSIASANSCFKLKELFDNTMQAESRYFGYDRTEQAAYRQDTIDDLYARARAGDKVGGKLFMTFLTEGVQEFKVASKYSYVPDNGRVPGLAEHYVHQQLNDLPVPIYRPQIMVNAKSFYPISEEEQFQLFDIYRNALASKSSLSTGHKRTDQNVTESNMTSLTLGLVSLNLGHINRRPIIAGAFKFDKWIRESEKVLPYLVFQNGGHIIKLCEASDDQGGIERHSGLCQKNGCIGCVVHSHADISAPALACFLRGSHEAGSWIELLGHHQAKTENKVSHKQFWSFHGAIFRCVFGRNTSGTMIDPSTGIRTQAPPSSDYTDMPEIPEFEDALGSTTVLGPDESILVLNGRLDVQDMTVPAYRTGITNRDVFHLGLSEVRIGVFHMSSFGWCSGYQEGCENWVKFLTAAIAAQADFVTGDGNLFAQRNFKQDAHTDYKSCILVDLLERLLAEINQHRSGMNQITYNLCSSIQAGAYIRAMSGDTNFNADCMLMISLSYGKQSQVSLKRTDSQKATADGVVGSAFADEVLLQDSKRPKYLQNIDLGLKDSDQAAHSPLVLVAKLHCQRNLRTRSDRSDQRRRGRRFGRPQYQAQDDEEEEEEEVEVEEEEEENEPVGRLRSTTPSSGARLHGRDDKARGSFENTSRVPVAPPKTPLVPPPRRRERSVTPPGRNTQRRANMPPVRTPPQRSWLQQQQYEYQRSSQPYTRQTPRASAPAPPVPPPPPAPTWRNRPAQPAQPPAYWQRGTEVEYDPGYRRFTGPRWTRNADGSWFDRCPEFPWQSIYFNQPTWQRRNNELWLYGYTFRMGF